MQQLPYVVVTNPHINQVYDLYYNAFNQFRKLKEIKTLEDNDNLCSIISHNLKGHLTVIPKLAMGILECGGLMDPQDLDRFMNTILRSVSSDEDMSRISEVAINANDSFTSASPVASSPNSIYPLPKPSRRHISHPAQNSPNPTS